MAITIATEYDLTPAGKRAARFVRTSQGNLQLRWYVAGRLFVRGASPSMTTEWLAGENGPMHRPQPWEAFA